MISRQLLNSSALALVLAFSQSNLVSAQTEQTAPAKQAGSGASVSEKADNTKKKLSDEQKAERKAARKAAKGEEKSKAKGNNEQQTPPTQEPAKKPSAEPVPPKANVLDAAKARPADSIIPKAKPSEAVRKPPAELAPQKEQASEPTKKQPVAQDAKQKAKPKADAVPAPAEIKTKTTVETAPAAPLSNKITIPQNAVPKAADTSKPAETFAAPVEQLPPAVVKDQLTAAEKEKLATAEQIRRSEKRKNRNKLIGAAAAGVVIGAVIRELGGKVVADEGDLIIVERDGRRFVRKDENERLRSNGSHVRTEQLPDGRQRTRVVRPDGVEVATLRDSGGYIIRRVKFLPNGDRIILIDNRDLPPTRQRRIRDELAPLQLSIARRDYIVESGRADRRQIRDTLNAQPVETVERAYTLSEIRDSERLRAKVRRIDLDTITFDTGSSSLTQSQVSSLEDIGDSLAVIIEENPREIFLIEGHTDAVGSDISNLALSDRRAEAIARILTDSFGVPPENMVVQGYGEQYLKVQTEDGERENRRVSVRRITALLSPS